MRIIVVWKNLISWRWFRLAPLRDVFGPSLSLTLEKLTGRKGIVVCLGKTTVCYHCIYYDCTALLTAYSTAQLDSSILSGSQPSNAFSTVTYNSMHSKSLPWMWMKQRRSPAGDWNKKSQKKKRTGSDSVILQQCSLIRPGLHCSTDDSLHLLFKMTFSILSKATVTNLDWSTWLWVTEV